MPNVQHNNDEEGIIRRCLDGDRDCYGILVERYRTLAYSVALRMMGDPDAANDAAQEAFLAAYTSLPRFGFRAKFSSWLTSIVLNKCRDLIRARRETVPVEEAAERGRAPGPDPEAAASGRETRDALQAALDRLPPDYREVIVMKHIAELDYREMAAILGVGIPALKVRAHRGREMLKRLLLETGVAP